MSRKQCGMWPEDRFLWWWWWGGLLQRETETNRDSVCRLEVNPELTPFFMLSILVSETGPLTGLEYTPGSQASELHGPAHFSFLSAEITSMHHHAQPFLCVFWGLNPGPHAVRPVLY